MTISSRALVALLLLACATLALALQPNDLGSWMGDEAHYLFLAQSLATGQGYRTINEPGAPPHTHYPPLFPPLLAPIVAVAGLDFRWLHLFVAGCGIMGVIWWSRCLWERGLPDRTVALVVLVLGTSPLWCLSIGRILSDIPYTAGLCGTLWAAHRCARSPSPRNRWLWLSIVGALALLFTRTIGIVAALAIACAWCDPRGLDRSPYRWRQGLVLLGSVMLAVGSWWLRNRLAAPGHSSYLDQLLLINPLAPDLGTITGDVGIRRVVGNAWFYGAAIADVFWSHQQPVPVLVRLVASVAWAFLLAIINVSWAVHLSHVRRAGYPIDPVEQEFRAVHAWLKEHTDPKDVIMSCRSPITALWAERRAINYPYTADAPRLIEAIDRHGVDYVIVDNFSPTTRQYLVPAVRQFVERFDPHVVMIGRQVVLRVRPRSDAHQ